MTDADPLVSVVLPTDGRPAALRRAVESVAAQTYAPIELLVVDDHSETPARETLADVDTSRLHAVRFIRHPTTRGASAVRNSGIRASRGSFVAFLDADDAWRPTKLQRQVEAFARASDDVGLVYTGTEYVAGGRPLRTETGGVRGDVTRDLLLGRSLSAFSGVLVRRRVVDEAGLPDERFPSWQDCEWFVRLSRHCLFESVDEPLTVRRVDGDDRVAREFERARDVTFPLFVETFRPLAAELGVERRFVAAHRAELGAAAVRAGRYADARRLLGRAVLSGHADWGTVGYLLASLGGARTYRSARRLARAVRRPRTST